jgi:hypothetical protein
VTAPRPVNFRALADAWDSPIAFAVELAKYYSQLNEAGYIMPAPDITQSKEIE